MFKSWWLSLFSVSLLIAQEAGAVTYTGGLETTSGNAGFNKDTLWVLIPRLFKWLMGFLGIIFLAVLIAGGIMWMTASGNQTQTQKAQQLITSAVIGLVIVTAAYALTAFLGDSFKP